MGNGATFPDFPSGAGPGTGPGLPIPSKPTVGLAEMVGFMEEVGANDGSKDEEGANEEDGDAEDTFRMIT